MFSIVEAPETGSTILKLGVISSLFNPVTAEGVVACMPDRNRWKRILHSNIFLCSIFAILTFAVFGQAIGFSFVNYDDPAYVSGNAALQQGLTPAGIRWAFTANLTHYAPAAEYWEPLTLLSRLADFELYGHRAGGPHLTNILLHLGAGLALFGALLQLTAFRWRSALVALLFLIHPLHVEPVAWISARKDLLNGLFYFLTVWAYAWYVRRPGLPRYCLMLAAFLGANFSKPMAVSLPVVLLLLDFWPLSRFRFDDGARSAIIPLIRCLLEKLPCFAIAAGVSVLACIDQRNHGALGDLDLFPLSVRLGNAALSCCLYLGRTLLPIDLAAFYPHPSLAINWLAVVFAAVFLLGCTALCFREIKRRPWLLMGWAWFLAVIFPVSGIIQIGESAQSDRYTYVALTGVFVILVWLGAELVTQLERNPMRWRTQRLPLAVSGAALLAILGILAWQQTTTWRDSISLWGHAIEVTDDNFVAQINLGSAFSATGNRGEAMLHLREAQRIHRPLTLFQLAKAARCEKEGDWKTAATLYQ
ncbi:MAG: hypothetical protein ABI871_07980, partial [Chthoniobacterales bacterium]